MNDINRVYLIGRLTADPELKTFQGKNQVCSFSIANNRSYSRQSGEAVDEVSFFNCSAWNKPGEIIHRYATKGSQIAIEGRLRQRRWQDKDGKNQSTIEIVIENFQFIGGRQDTSAGRSDRDFTPADANQSRGQHEPINSPEPNYSGYQGSSSSFDESIGETEDDIPF